MCRSIKQAPFPAHHLNAYIEHYLLPLLYPTALTRRLQIALGLLVLGVNLAVYWWVWRRTVKTKA